MSNLAVARLVREPIELVPLLLILLVAVLYVAGTWWGIGLRPDSSVYLNVWDEGRQQAPLYSWVMDIGSLAGVSAPAFAWLVNGLLLMLNVTLVWALLIQAQIDRTPAWVASALVALLPQFLYVHETALSEPLGITCLLACFFLLIRYREQGDVALLLLSAAFAAAAVLTRFAYAPVVGAGSLMLLIYGRGPLQRRFLDAMLYGALATGVFLAWLFINHTGGGEGVDRSFAFLGDPDFSTFMRAVDAFTSLLLPTFVPLFVRAALLITVAFILLWSGWRALRPTRAAHASNALQLARLCCIFFVSYLAFVIFTLFVENSLHIHARYIIPLYICAVLIVMVEWAAHPAFGGVHLVQRAVLALAAGLLLANAARAAENTYDMVRNGNFYASPTWYASPTIGWVRTLPVDVVIYSNGPDAIRLLTDRKAEFALSMYDFRTGMDNPTNPIATQFATLRQQLAADQAILVYFDKVDWREYLMPENEAVEMFDLHPIRDFEDGRVYGSAGMTLR